MVESYLLHGNQPLSDPTQLTSGLSITDPCLGWEDTEALLREAYDAL
jgi:3-deoxy-7-phosphoheptulonate synthase